MGSFLGDLPAPPSDDDSDDDDEEDKKLSDAVRDVLLCHVPWFDGHRVGTNAPYRPEMFKWTLLHTRNTNFSIQQIPLLCFIPPSIC